MGILIGLIVTVLGYQTGKVDKLNETFNHSLSGVKEDVSAIQVDVGQIKTSLEFIGEDLKEIRQEN